MVTIDFDTNFFVWLARARREHAEKVLAALNKVGVRHVLSGTVWMELIWNTSRPDQDDSLVERLRALMHPPLCLLPGLSWDALLDHGPGRVELAEQFREQARLGTMGEAFGYSARSGIAKKSGPAFIEANRELFRSIGVIGADDAFKVPWDSLRMMAASIGVEVPEGQEQRPREELLKFAMALQARLQELAPEGVRQIEEQNRLLDSMAATDNRPRQIVLGDRSKLSEFGHTIRDRDRAAHFVEHAADTDFFQVDRPQWKLINRRKPPHRLAELGLANRCFSVRSLDEVVATVTALSAGPPLQR